VEEVRLFARDEIGLNVGDHYTTFYDAGDEPVAYNLSASLRDRFAPYYWTFPLVGSVPFLGFFDRELALAKRDELRTAGYDVFIYEVDAYYALGVFSNPILSPMLDRPEESLIDTVIHELTHGTVTRANDTSFNESLATFVGRTGAVQFLEHRFADEPERQAAALARFADIDTYSEFMLTVYNELDAYYQSDLPSDAKISGRESVYQAGRDRFSAEIQAHLNNPRVGAGEPFDTIFSGFFCTLGLPFACGYAILPPVLLRFAQKTRAKPAEYMVRPERHGHDGQGKDSKNVKEEGGTIGSGQAAHKG
jgi:predicted aminopeptidase